MFTRDYLFLQLIMSGSNAVFNAINIYTKPIISVDELEGKLTMLIGMNSNMACFQKKQSRFRACKKFFFFHFVPTWVL